MREGHVVLGHLAFALEHMDRYGWLVVRSRSEDLALVGRDGRVAVDQLGENAAESLNAERERRDVEQEDVLHVAGEDAALDGSAHRYDFIGVHRTVGFLAEEFTDSFLDKGHTCHAADENDFIDLRCAHSGIGQCLAARLDGTLDKIGNHLFQLRTGKLGHEMLWAGGICSDEGKVDLRFHCRREFLLGIFGGFLQALQSHPVCRKVDAVHVFEILDQIFDDALVEIFAAQERVAVGGADFDDAVADFEDRDIEGTAAKVINRDLLVDLLVEAIRERSGSRLIDDALYVKTGDAAGVLGRLALGIVEICRYRDDGFSDHFAQIGFRVSLQLGENER